MKIILDAIQIIKDIHTREKIALFVLFLFLFSFYLFNNIISLIDIKENQWTLTRWVPAAAPHNLGIDFHENYQYAKLFFNGKSPYSRGSIYPPFETVFFSPLAFFPYHTAYIYQVILLFLICVACIYFSVEIAFCVFSGLDDENKKSAIIKKIFIFLGVSFAVLNSYGFMFNLERGNYDLYALFFSVLFLLIIIRWPRHLWLAVITLSIAIHLKLYPAILVMLLLWKYGKKSLIPFIFINTVLLFILGPSCVRQFMENMTKFAGNPYFWIGNHSAASFARLLTDGLFFDFKNIKTLLTFFPIGLWFIGSLILFFRRYNPVNAVLFFCLSIPLMNILPPVSHDYKLVLLSVPFAMILSGLLYNFINKARYFSLLVMIVLFFAFGFTLRSWIETPYWLQNKYPFIFSMLVLFYLIILFPQGVFKPKEFNENSFDRYAKFFSKTVIFIILPVIFFASSLIYIKRTTVIVTRDPRPEIAYAAKKTSLGLKKKQFGNNPANNLLQEVTDDALLLDIRFNNISDKEKDSVTLSPMILEDTFSLEVIVKPAEHQNTFADIISNHPGFNWFEGMVIQQSGGSGNSFGFCFGTGKEWGNGVSFELVPNKWNYIAINVRKDKIDLFINGQLADTVNAGAVFKNSGYPMDIGNWKDENRPFSGFIRQVRILNRSLTETEMSGAWKQIKQQLVDVAVNASGVLSEAEKNCGIVSLAVKTPLGLLRKGENTLPVLLGDIKSEDLLLQIGFNDAQTIQNTAATLKPLILPECFTIEAILNPALNQKAFANIITNHPGVKWYEGFAMQEDGSNTNTYAFFFGDGKVWSLPVKFTLEPEKWNYLAIEVNGDKARLYLNGKFFDWVNMNIKYRNSDFPVDIGNWHSADRPFAGKIKEARISCVILSDDLLVKAWDNVREKYNPAVEMVIPATGSGNLTN